MSLLFSLLPLLAIAVSIIGIALLTLGIRGRPVFSHPHCRKCGYDLRNMQFASEAIGDCPECGLSLAAPGAVSFGRWQCRPKQIVLGLAVLALPWIAGAVGSYVMRMTAPVNSSNIALQSTPAILASLPANIDELSHWQELEQRLKTRRLTTVEIDTALALLAADLSASGAARVSTSPVAWSSGFVAAAAASGTASQSRIDEVCRAYYADAPALKLRRRARVGHAIAVGLNDSQTWRLNGLQFCWALRGIVADGTTKLTPFLRYGIGRPLVGDALSGTDDYRGMDVLLTHYLPPGEHELTFSFDLGVVPESVIFRGVDGKPGTADKWPTPISRWQATIERKVLVVENDEPRVALVTDPARNPLGSSMPVVEQMFARPGTGGTQLVVKWRDNAGPPSLALSYAVSVEAGGKRLDFGRYVIGDSERGTFSSISEDEVVPTLSRDVNTVNLLFTPDPEAVDFFLEVEEIWGHPTEIRDVPVRRLDLE